MSIYDPNPCVCSWCGAKFHRAADLGMHADEHRKGEITADIDRGRRAREDGQPLGANPFPPGTHPFVHWQNGWHEVDEGIQIERAA